jgi:hypothetical protein
MQRIDGSLSVEERRKITMHRFTTQTLEYDGSSHGTPLLAKITRHDSPAKLTSIAGESFAGPNNSLSEVRVASGRY